jgi:hypothetical protein
MHCSFTRAQLERKKQSAVRYPQSLSPFGVLNLRAERTCHHPVEITWRGRLREESQKDDSHGGYTEIIFVFGGVLSPASMSKS